MELLDLKINRGEVLVIPLRMERLHSQEVDTGLGKRDLLLYSNPRLGLQIDGETAFHDRILKRRYCPLACRSLQNDKIMHTRVPENPMIIDIRQEELEPDDLTGADFQNRTRV
jgi:hypothetical protein